MIKLFYYRRILKHISFLKNPYIEAKLDLRDKIYTTVILIFRNLSFKNNFDFFHIMKFTFDLTTSLLLSTSLYFSLILYNAVHSDSGY
jgi:hypothetical protein